MDRSTLLAVRSTAAEFSVSSASRHYAVPWPSGPCTCPERAMYIDSQLVSTVKQIVLLLVALGVIFSDY